jgi:hypothetical protein
MCIFELLFSIVLMKKMIFFILITITTGIFAQFPFPLKEYTDSLAKLGEKIIGGHSDFARFEANEKFRQLLLFMISHDKAESIDFSEVKNLSVLGPDNKDFRIFSWVVPKTDGSFECFGISSGKNERRKNYQITELNDVKSVTTNAERKQFRKGEWWGALYYEIIPVRSNGIQYYTLLGWDGNNALSTRKVIDVVSFSPSGMPAFGASLFQGYGKQMKRIVFEYSDNVQMVLRYEKQSYIFEKMKKTKQKRSKTGSNIRKVSDGFRAIKSDKPDVRRRKKSATMIVFDRLMPMNPSLTGVYEFYVPELNIVDGFLFFNGKWNYIPDIDARNEPSSKDETKPVQFKQKVPVLQDEK